MGDNLPAVRQMVDIDGKRLRKKRVGEALATAIRYIEEQGYSVGQAAEATGYKRNSLFAALAKPHVKVFRAGVKRAWRDAAAPKAWNQITKLAEAAGSEKVRLEASKTVLAALGELTSEEGGGVGAPALIQFIKAETHHHHGPQPLTQRLPGVVQGEDFQDADYEPLDSKPGLTGQDDT